MGSILNQTSDGDPINEVTAVGFTTQAEALEYVANGFRGGSSTFSRELQRDGVLEFSGNPTAVFWDVTPGGVQRLLSVTQVFGTLSLVIGSIGNQFTLRGAF